MANQSSARSNRDKRRPALPTGQGGHSTGAARPPADSVPPLPWSPKVRAIASALILFHLVAAFIAAVVASPPRSELAAAVATIFRPYFNAVELNHGYRFFAPNPGPSHLVRYHLEFTDGSKRDGVFPNLDEQRPRLLYHRYFMLSEKLFDMFYGWQMDLERSKESPSLAERSEATKAAEGQQQIYHAFAKSYADELLRRTGANKVTLELVVHMIPLPDDVAAGQRLNDPKLYQTADTIGPYSNVEDVR